MAFGYDHAPDVRNGPNLYTYVRQNPWTKFDPQGLSPALIIPGGELAFGLGAAVVAGYAAYQAGESLKGSAGIALNDVGSTASKIGAQLTSRPSPEHTAFVHFAKFVHDLRSRPSQTTTRGTNADGPTSLPGKDANALGKPTVLPGADATPQSTPDVLITTPVDTPRATSTDQTNNNPFVGPVQDGVVVVDPAGNAIPVKPGQQIEGSPNGRFSELKDAQGKKLKDSQGNPSGIRIDGGHSNHTDPRAQDRHVHRDDVGATNEDGTPWLPMK